MSTANLLADIFTLFAIGIPLLRAVNELLKAVKKSPPDLSERVIELEGDQAVSKRLIDCLNETDRLRAVLKAQGLDLTD
jgi:hypothetical protein